MAYEHGERYSQTNHHGVRVRKRSGALRPKVCTSVPKIEGYISTQPSRTGRYRRLLGLGNTVSVPLLLPSYDSSSRFQAARRIYAILLCRAPYAEISTYDRLLSYQLRHLFQ